MISKLDVIEIFKNKSGAGKVQRLFLLEVPSTTFLINQKSGAGEAPYT